MSSEISVKIAADTSGAVASANSLMKAFRDLHAELEKAGQAGRAFEKIDLGKLGTGTLAADLQKMQAALSSLQSQAARVPNSPIGQTFTRVLEGEHKKLGRVPTAVEAGLAITHPATLPPPAAAAQARGQDARRSGRVARRPASAGVEGDRRRRPRFLEEGCAAGAKEPGRPAGQQGPEGPRPQVAHRFGLHAKRHVAT